MGSQNFVAGQQHSGKSDLILLAAALMPAQTGFFEIFGKPASALDENNLAERLRAEKSNPQCDVWWGNEPFHTINLADEGLLQPYESPSAGDIAGMYKDS
ncbi:hypothetical protein B4Q13_24285, partial [Lacticaseibacillus rhamnosus]